MNGYKQTGAFFFKDRGVLIPRVAQDGEFISSLGPSDLETTLFGIPQMTQHTLGNPFFRGLVHYQESGLLVINKTYISIHIDGHSIDIYASCSP